MTTEQWESIADDIVGLWGSGHQAIVTRRIEALRKRFATERVEVMQTAVKHLEVSAAHWPPVKDFHLAVDRAKTRLHGAGYAKRDPHDAPLTARECIDLAADLVKAAAARVSSGRGEEGDGWHTYLLALAEFYERGAAELRGGGVLPWPPPAKPPIPALARVFVDASVADARDSRKRHQLEPPEYEDDGGGWATP